LKKLKSKNLRDDGSQAALEVAAAIDDNLLLEGHFEKGKVRSIAISEMRLREDF